MGTGGSTVGNIESSGADTVDHATLRAEFDALGPWITRFEIDGEEYGGWYDAPRGDDTRLQQFLAAFPKAKSVLELGCLEGGHTVAIVRALAPERVVGIEGRTANAERARLVMRALGLTMVEIREGDLETIDLAALGRFDAVFNCGLLYHLPRPWELLGRIARVTRGMYLATHYCADADVNTEVEGYQGRAYGEYGLDDPLSGLSEQSFWPTRESLLRMLRDSGFGRCEVSFDQPDHENGPLIGITARVRRFRLPRRSSARTG